ncbi:SDR family NAD(P)-dependent oxidoreductase [Caldifermentibacillus hisashii]|uniref:SDR family NAD(P)-dependent oxidoreductase n=1 Tax=Caldifermentibacillus hisashii TaxID=996558 RepID=UPI0034D6FE37
MKLKDKVAIVTGASAGIGKATAELFIKEGAKVVLTDIKEVEGQKVASEIGSEAIFIKHDVAKEDDWIHVVNTTIDKFGKIDILVNNAGVYYISPLAEITLEKWNWLMSINVTGVFLGMKHVLPHMAKNKKGSVINLSSIAGLGGASGHALYGASKGAVRIMTKDVATEYGPFNVRVNSVHPSYIKTAMASYGAETAQTSIDELGKDYPLRRIGNPEEVAATCLFLASDDSSFITGQEIVVDGGVTAAL